MSESVNESLVLCSGTCQEMTDRAAEQPEWFIQACQVRGKVAPWFLLPNKKIALCSECERQAVRRVVISMLRGPVSERDGGGALVYKALDLLCRGYGYSLMPIDGAEEAA